jgi:serine/threonine protein phosphatase PrpC
LLTLEEFAGRGDQFLACVFDGHGPNGGFASRYVRDCLPGLWSAKLLESSTGSVFQAAHAGSLHKMLHEGCVEANRSLSSSNIDVYVSGSAGIAALVCGNKLFVANVGDCRCVVGARSGEGIMDAVEMSTDHEPTRTEEEKRILAAGGRIFEWGVPRVWLRDVDMPGLAMSRSFGDLAAESVGVHAEPEIKELVLTTAHRLMIMASDGIWEFIDSQEAVDIIAPFVDKADPHAAAEALVREAVKRWTADEEAVDDITVVVAFFNYPMPSVFVHDHPECGFLR